MYDDPPDYEWTCVGTTKRSGPKPEGTHTTGLIKGFLKAKAYAHKIPDPVGSFKTSARPWDVTACLQGRAIAIECKWLKAPKAFGISALREVQVKNLAAWERAGGSSYVVLFTKYNNRIHMLVWPFKDLTERGGSVSTRIILSLLDGGYSYLSVNGAFPIGAFLDPPHRPLYGLTE